MMILASDFGTKAWGAVRSILIWIDSIGFSLVDNVYSVMIQAMRGFNADAIKTITSGITKNAYIIVSIFALFRIGIILVNAIIDPDKLTDKKKGVSNVLVHFLITIVLFVIVPIAFDKARDLQNTIVDNGYVSNLILGTNITGEKVATKTNDDGTVTYDTAGIGDAIQATAIKAIIKPDDRLYNGNIGDECINNDINKDALIDKCTGDCETAITAWCQNRVRTRTLSKFMDTYVKLDSDQYVFAYDYMPFVTLIIGLVVTYIFLSFTIDIAVRSVELVALEILSPIFIVTYIDPEMASNGPFKKWLKACGTTYLSLFIKIAIISLMLLLLSYLDTLMGSLNGNGWLKLFMMLAILIFAKKAPKWIGDMSGMSDSSGLSSLGIGKKLGGAALVGGAIGKGIDSAKKFGTQKTKNFGSNRARNTAARIGGMKEQHKKNKNLEKSDRRSLWSAGRASAKQSRSDNWGQNAQGLFKDVGAGYTAGRKNLNPEAETIGEKMQLKADLKANAQNAAIGNTDLARAHALEVAANNKEARKMYGENAMIDPKTGDRIKNDAGKYINPRGTKEMNDAFANPTSEDAAYKAYGTNLANARGLTIDAANGTVTDKSGKTMSLTDYGQENMSYAGQLQVKSLVADNIKKDVANYQSAMTSKQEASASYSKAITEYNAAQQSLVSNTEYSSAHQKSLDIINNSDYVDLKNKDSNDLSDAEKAKLKLYNEELSAANTTINKIENETGVVQMNENVEQTKKELNAWAKEVEKYENKFETAKNNPSIVYDDDGKPKKNADGSIKTENPYEVTINGEKLNPVDNFARLEEINTTLATKSEKAKSKASDAMKEAEATAKK